MKHNWSYSTIGVELKTSSGGTPNKMHKEFYEGGNIPWLRSGEVCKKNITETEIFITQKGMDNSSAKWFPENTVLVAMYGATAGQVGILRFPSTTNQAICGIFPNDKFLPEFLYYTLLYSKDTLVSQAVGNAQPNISQIKVKEVPLPKISIEEQQRIVDILDKEFEKIDTLKANAEKGLQQAKDLFQSVLRQKLQPKEGWVVSTLHSLLRLTSGDNLTAKSIVQGEYPVYGGNGIMGYHNQYNLDGLNVIVGRVGALCGNVRLTKGKIWYTDNAFLVHDKKNLFHLSYLVYELQKVNLRQYATQAAQPVISNVSMKDVLLSVPPTIEEQEQIVAHLDKLKAHCNILQKNYEKTIALCDDMKQALLRKAFNGEF